MWVADYSTSRPDLAALKAAGCSGIVRYAVNVPGTTDKQVYQSEIDLAISLGMTVTIVQESGAQPALFGYQRGVTEAQAANDRMDTLGYPADCWIYYTAEDPNMVPQSSWPIVADYFRGVASLNRRPIGGYGGVALLNYLAGLGLISRKWAVDPWGGHAGCDLAQYAAPVPPGFSNDIDANLVLSADYGQHPRPGAVATSNMSGQEPSSMIIVTHPNGLRQDVVWVAADGIVHHGWTGDSGDLTVMAVEAIGGTAKSVSASWSKDGHFRVVAHGRDDTPYVKVSDGQRWVQEWTQLPNITMLAPNAGPPGPAGPVYDDRWIHAQLAAIKAAITG